MLSPRVRSHKCSVLSFLQAAAQAAQGAGGGGGHGGLGPGSGGIDPTEIAQLRDSPAFRQIRELVSQNPDFIQPLIQHLAESNPQLAHQLASNPEMLYQLLGGEVGGVGGVSGVGGAEGAEWEGGVPPGSTAIHVTEEEAAAIARVSGDYIMGFGAEVLTLYLPSAPGPRVLAGGSHRSILRMWKGREPGG